MSKFREHIIELFETHTIIRKELPTDLGPQGYFPGQILCENGTYDAAAQYASSPIVITDLILLRNRVHQSLSVNAGILKR